MRCRKNFLDEMRDSWISHFSVQLVRKSTDCPCFRLSFQGYLYSKQPWKSEIVQNTEQNVYRLVY